MWNQHWRCFLVLLLPGWKIQPPPAAEPQNNEIREGIITRKTWKQQHIYRLMCFRLSVHWNSPPPFSFLLQDHSERDEGVPTRRPHWPLQDDQTRERQTQRAQPAEVPQLRPLRAPPLSRAFFFLSPNLSSLLCFARIMAALCCRARTINNLHY